MLLSSQIRKFIPAAVAAALFASAAGAMSDEELIAEAMTAAPPAVAKNATIMAFNEDGSMRKLRDGTNGFTCMPDDPSPGHNPMCLDQNAMVWAKAWMTRTEPPRGKVGFGYMLAGGGTPSNLDPYATETVGGGDPVPEPPHVMLFNLPEPAMDYPRPDEDPDRSQPWVMWKDTPYEHLMIPVK